MLIDKGLSDEETAERIMRHRARVMPVLIALYLFVDVHSARDLAETGSLLDPSFISWIIMTLGLLILLATGGEYVMRHPGLHQFYNDELTRDHRAKAYSAGFWAFLAGAIALAVASPWLAVTTVVAVHALTSLGTFAALARYTLLERRALRQ